MYVTEYHSLGAEAETGKLPGQKRAVRKITLRGTEGQNTNRVEKEESRPEKTEDTWFGGVEVQGRRGARTWEGGGGNKGKASERRNIQDR